MSYNDYCKAALSLVIGIVAECSAQQAVVLNDRTAAKAELFPLDLAFSARTTTQNSEAALVSPTGRHLVVAILAPSKVRTDVSTFASGLPVWMQGVRLHVVEIATGKSMAVSTEAVNSFCPAWSPDGTKLAYYSDEGGFLRAWVLDLPSGRAKPAAETRIKVHVYCAAAMSPSWSPDGRELLVPALPADEFNSDPRPPYGLPKDKKGRAGAWPGVLVMTTGKEPAPPPEAEIETLSHYDAVVDIVSINLINGGTRIVLPSKPTGRLGPAFAQFSHSGQYISYVSQYRRGLPAQFDHEVEVGVLKVGETQPIYVETVKAEYNEKPESYSGEFLGRSGIVLAWNSAKDILVFVSDGKLRRLDLTSESTIGSSTGESARRPATLGADIGRFDGTYLAFTQDSRAVLVDALASQSQSQASEDGLVLVPLDGAPPRKLTWGDGFKRGRLVRQGSSLWQPIADTATFLNSDFNGPQTVIRRLDLISGKWSVVKKQPATIQLYTIPRDGSFLVGSVESYTQASDFFTFDADFTPKQRLTTIEPRLAVRELGAAETFQTVVPLYDGTLKSVRTAVLLPPGAKKGDRLPALVSCYGGENRSRLVRYYGGGDVAAIASPVFTSRGYVVLLCDAPIGPEGRPGQPIEELRDVVLPQIYHAAELGYIDISRLAIVGNSYGGYAAAALISSTNLFRAAIAIAGVYDLPGQYGQLRPAGDDFPMEWSEKGQGRMGQPPWNDLRRYMDNSPYYRADRIRTPLLILHGREDNGGPVAGAEMMFSSLKRLGRSAQLAVYEGEGHAISEWGQKNAIDATQRILEFLRRHLEE